ncbi:hypothetical protein BKG87_22050 [Mycobacteroides chelonae]|nr:hypothetical protein BKG87_22050 [Mycobacteroides chelonae]
MSELIDRAKASLEGVTEGPWVSWKDRESRESYSDGYVYRGNVISDSTKQIVVTKSGNAANSLFIAAARQLVPELIAEVERLRQECDAWELKYRFANRGLIREAILDSMVEADRNGDSSQ